LAKVSRRRIVAVAVIETHVIRIHFVNVQVAVGMVVAIRLVVFGISQPPSAAVGSLPRPLLSSGALHGVLGAATTTVGGTSHVNNEVRLLRVVVDVLAHSVIHEGPVFFVARRPNLETIRARIFFGALPDSETVADLDQLTSRVTLHREVCNLAVACAALPTALRWSRASCLLAQVVSRRISAAAVIETHVVGIHIIHVQVAVGVVVAIRLVVLGISQPPSAAVGSLP